MSITLNTVVYANDVALSPNKYQYLSPSHDHDSKDMLVLSRTAAKPTATFAGVTRSEAKRTKTVTLADSTTAEAIVTISCSFPVGMAKADADALRDDIGDLAIATEGDELMWKHIINT